jgi:hypothetical protein
MAMNITRLFFRACLRRTLALTATLALAGCSHDQPPPPPPAPPSPSIGRYQIFTATRPEHEPTCILLDTTSGETWLYHVPQGPLYNGFWGDVPRVTTPGETWRQAFQTLIQEQPTNRAPGVPFEPIR